MKNPTMLSFVRDLPNIFSLAGLLCSLMAIYWATVGLFAMAMIAILWAVVFDWSDGIIARKMKNRNDSQREFGAQLDSLIDMVSFGVFPAVFLFSYGNFQLIFLPGAFLLLAAAAIRLSYFNVFGLSDGKHYTGLALDNNMIVLPLFFLFEKIMVKSTFTIVLYLFLVSLVFFNLAPLKTPKFSGRWFYGLIAYAVVLSSLLVFSHL